VGAFANTYVVSASSVSDSTEPKTATATCNAGDRAVGGGGVTNNNDVYLTQSRPNTTGANPTGWSVSAAEDGTNVTAAWTVTAYVVCADTP